MAMKSIALIPLGILILGFNPSFVESGIGFPSLGDFMSRLRSYHHPRGLKPMPISRRVSSNGQFKENGSIDDMTYEQKKEALKRLLMKSTPSKDSANVKPIAMSLLQE